MALNPMLALRESIVLNWCLFRSGQCEILKGLTKKRDAPIKAADTTIPHFRPTRGISMSCAEADQLCRMGEGTVAYSSREHGSGNAGQI